MGGENEKPLFVLGNLIKLARMELVAMDFLPLYAVVTQIKHPVYT